MHEGKKDKKEQICIRLVHLYQGAYAKVSFLYKINKALDNN